MRHDVRRLPFSRDGGMTPHPVFELIKVTAFMLRVKIWTLPAFRRIIHNCKKWCHIGSTHKIFANCLNAMIHMHAILLFRRVQAENCVVVVVTICVLSNKVLHSKLNIEGKCL
jgi:hypothetical protein